MTMQYPEATARAVVPTLCALLDLFAVGHDQENALEWELTNVLAELPAEDLATVQALVGVLQTRLQRYISLDDLASTFKVRPKVIRALVRGGALRASTRKGRLVFDRADVERWLSTRTFTGVGHQAERVPDTIL